MPETQLRLDIDSSGWEAGAKKAERALNKVDRTTQKTDRTLDRFGNSSKKSLNKTSNAAQFAKAQIVLLGAAVATVATALAGKSVASFFQYDKALGQILTLTDLTSQQTRQLEGSLKSLATTYGISATDNARAYYQVLSAGFVIQKDAVQLLDIANRAAIAGGAGLVQTTNLITSILVPYKIAVADATRVADVLFTIVQYGKTTIDELASSFGRSTTRAKAAGLEFTALGAIIGTVTANSTITSEGFTQLNAFLTSITTNSTGAQAAMAKYGIDISTTALKAKGAQKYFADLKDAVGVDPTKIVQLFGSSEAAGLITTLLSDLPLFNKILRISNNELGIMDGAFQKVSDTASQRWDVAITGLQTKLLILGKTIANFIVPAVELFNNNTKTAGVILTSFGLLLATFNPYIGVITAAAGAALFLTSSFTKADSSYNDLEASAKRFNKELSETGDILEEVGDEADKTDVNFAGLLVTGAAISLLFGKRIVTSASTLIAKLRVLAASFGIVGAAAIPLLAITAGLAAGAGVYYLASKKQRDENKLAGDQFSKLYDSYANQIKGLEDLDTQIRKAISTHDDSAAAKIKDFQATLLLAKGNRAAALGALKNTAAYKSIAPNLTTGFEQDERLGFSSPLKRPLLGTPNASKLEAAQLKFVNDQLKAQDDIISDLNESLGNYNNLFDKAKADRAAKEIKLLSDEYDSLIQSLQPTESRFDIYSRQLIQLSNLSKKGAIDSAQLSDGIDAVNKSYGTYLNQKLIDLKTQADPSGFGKQQAINQINKDISEQITGGNLTIDAGADLSKTLIKQLEANASGASIDVKVNYVQDFDALGGTFDQEQNKKRQIQDAETLRDNARNQLASGGAGANALTKFDDNASKTIKNLENSINGVTASYENGIDASADFFTSIANGSKKASDSIEDLAKTLQNKLIKQGFLKILGGLFGGPGSFGGDVLSTIFSANGNAFDNGNLIPFARGGVTNGPVSFPLAGNNIGVAGEAGKEAILPLSRNRNGNLGVEVSGGDSSSTNQINIVNNIDATGADAAGLERVETAIAELNGSQESRTLKYINNFKKRRLI